MEGLEYIRFLLRDGVRPHSFKNCRVRSSRWLCGNEVALDFEDCQE